MGNEALLEQIATDLRYVKEALKGQDNRYAVPLEEAQSILGCERSTIFRLLKREELRRAPRLGRGVMITLESIRSAQRQEQTVVPKPKPRPPMKAVGGSTNREAILAVVRQVTTA